tara:strand:+ start:837 stop:1418 length:582 start_codon:yes stop_codon:yes gene_type:complete
MAQSTGTNKIKTAVFFSGNGSNLKSLIKFSRKKRSPISIEIIITNNPKAKGLKFGKIFKIKNKSINYKNKYLAEKKIFLELKRCNIKLICLAGFMKIISKNFIKKFKGKIINIHPSLLPKYKGLRTHERVIRNNEKFSGCTVHFVSAKLDSGKIILQKKVRISKKDTPNILAKKILVQEHKIYPRAIMKIISL